MSNVDKLLDSLLKANGEKLVIGTVDPIHVLKSGKQLALMKKVLGEKEFQLLEDEFLKQYGNQGQFSYNNKVIATSRQGTVREFWPVSAVPPAVPQPQAVHQVKQNMPPVPPTPPPPPISKPEPVQGQPPSVQTASVPPVSVQTVSDPANISDAPVVISNGSFSLDFFLEMMPKRKASDLHLTTGCNPMMRIDGDMENLEEFPNIDEQALYKELVRIAPPRNIEEFKETNDTDFAYEIKGVARFRANMFRDTRGVGAVFRIIPSKILTVEQLDVPRAMVRLCDIPKGLILVTGPTGSGKSTTLAALIDHINTTQRKHIITIEDPVEFVHPKKLALINQREVHSHTQSFKRALRAALREDPDIILVGEMRDLETIAIAVEMAITGHLVFGTLHTSTAIGTIDRIIDQFPSDQQAQIKTMLSDALIGVCAQTLPKKIGGGRVGAYEVLVVTNAVSNLIREGKCFQIATLMQTGKAIGMQMINSHLAELVEKKIVDADEAISKAVDKDNLRMTLKNKGLINE